MLEVSPAAVPEPTATGLLSEKPLAHLLAYAHEHKMSGTFELADDPRQYALIVVSQGGVARVWTSEPVSYLGHVLYENGALNDAQLGASLAEIATTKALHGQVLLSQHIINVAQLSNALRQQRLRKLQHAFTFPPASRFSFYADVALIEERPGDVEPADPLPSIWRGICEQPSPEHVQAVVSAVGPRAVRFTGACDVQTFRKEDRDAIESLRHWPATIEAVAARPGMDQRAAELLVYFLIVTKHGEVAAATVAPAPAAEPVAFRAPGQSIRPSGAFSMRAPAPAIRIPGAPASSPNVSGPSSSRSGGSVGDGPASSPGGIPEASTSVRDIPAPEPSQPSPSMPAPAKESPETEAALSQAELHFVLEEWREALKFVRDALQISPKSPAALLLFNALEAQTVRKGNEDKLRDILKRMDNLMARNNIRRARFYRGQIRLRVGDKIGAVHDFREAVAADPDDPQAQRELQRAERLAERDEEEPKPKSMSMSFLDRLDKFRRR